MDIVDSLNERCRIVDKRQIEIENLVPDVIYEIISVLPVEDDTMGKVILVEVNENVFYLPKMYTSAFTASIIQRINSKQVKISVIMHKIFHIRTCSVTHTVSFCLN